MLRAAVAAVSIVTVTTVVFAQSDNPVSTRIALMKETGSNMGTIAKMIKGEAPFDKDAAERALKKVAENAKKVAALFPEGSDQGETRARKEIWSNKADFDARFAKLASDAEAALAHTGSLDQLRPAFGPVGASCGGCHEVYRTP